MPPSESLVNARLALAFVTMLLVSGIGNTFPVFFPPLLAEFGGSRAGTASTVTLIWAGGAALSPLAGYLVAAWSPRLLVSLGLGAASLGLTLAALAPTLGVFALSLGIGGGIGVGLTGMVTQAAVIADTYVSRRGFATGIAFSGSMAAHALSGPAQWAITNLGWRGALAAYVVAVLALVPCALRVYPVRLRAAASGSGEGRSVRDITGSAAFWTLVIVSCLPPLVGYLATIQHTLYLTARGFSVEEASVLLVIGGVLSTGGRALAGLASDRFGAGAAGILSYSVSLAGMLCLLGMEVHPARLLVYGYVFLVFLPLGSRATIVSVLVSRIAPPTRYGMIFGLLSIGNNLGAAAGPLLSGAIYDRTGSYLVIYVVASVLLLVGLAALVAFCAMTADRRRSV